jgi:hypothetical protein
MAGWGQAGEPQAGPGRAGGADVRQGQQGGGHAWAGGAPLPLRVCGKAAALLLLGFYQCHTPCYRFAKDKQPFSPCSELRTPRGGVTGVQQSPLLDPASWSVCFSVPTSLECRGRSFAHRPWWWQWHRYWLHRWFVALAVCIWLSCGWVATCRQASRPHAGAGRAGGADVCQGDQGGGRPRPGGRSRPPTRGRSPLFVAVPWGTPCLKADGAACGQVVAVVPVGAVGVVGGWVR